MTDEQWDIVIPRLVAAYDQVMLEHYLEDLRFYPSAAFVPGSVWTIQPKPGVVAYPKCERCGVNDPSCLTTPQASGWTPILCATCAYTRNPTRPSSTPDPRLFNLQAEPEHCLCSACCSGLDDLCESLPAPEEPTTFLYHGQDGGRYELRTTGEWKDRKVPLSDAVTRYRRVALPEGEQVPCGWSMAAWERDHCRPECPGWTATGWTMHSSVTQTVLFLCDTCHGDDSDYSPFIARSRAVPPCA